MYSTRHYDKVTGLETWFALPDLKTEVASSSPPSPKWKMAIVIFIAAYIISLIAQSILSPFIGQWSILINNFIYTIMMVILLTYFAMPIMSRFLRL
jgi:uncharacterized protein